MYNKKIEISSVDRGYLCFIDKQHPLSNKVGRVFHHRHVASIKASRWLTSEDHVHHIDGNRKNNNPNNLEILTPSEHAKKHTVEIMDRIHGEDNWEFRDLKDITCPTCKKVFTQKTSNQKYCSHKCQSVSLRRADRPSKEELMELIKKHPMTHLGKMFGVSDNAVRKWAKNYGIETKKPKKNLQTVVCPVCKKEFKQKREDQKCCSKKCGHEKRRVVEWPTKEKLKILTKTMNTSSIAKEFKVTHNTIKSWMIYYEID